MATTKKIRLPYVWPAELVHTPPVVVNVGKPGSYRLIEIAAELLPADITSSLNQKG